MGSADTGSAGLLRFGLPRFPGSESQAKHFLGRARHPGSLFPIGNLGLRDGPAAEGGKIGGHLPLLESAFLAPTGEVHYQFVYTKTHCQVNKQIRIHVTNGDCSGFSLGVTCQTMATKRGGRTGGGRGSRPKHEPTIVGVNLRRLRGERDLTGEELAAAVGLQQGQVANIESGATQYPRANTLRLFADFFGVLMEEFWRPVDDAPAVEPALRQLVQSGIAGDISADEMDRLRSARPLLRNPTPRAMMALLEAIRLSGLEEGASNGG